MFSGDNRNRFETRNSYPLNVKRRRTVQNRISTKAIFFFCAVPKSTAWVLKVLKKSTISQRTKRDQHTLHTVMVQWFWRVVRFFVIGMMNFFLLHFYPPQVKYLVPFSFNLYLLLFIAIFSSTTRALTLVLITSRHFFFRWVKIFLT